MQEHEGLASSWAVRAAAGEPVAVVRLRNLQAVIQGPQDAWGRPNKPQPLIVSAELSFLEPFKVASAHDKVDLDTVHYGHLSKRISASLASFPSKSSSHGNSNVEDAAASLRSVLEMLWANLTGRRTDGTAVKTEDAQTPLVDVTKLRYMAITLSLPKACLLGEAVSLTASAMYNNKGQFPQIPYSRQSAICLRINRLRVPTLVGVNSNERLARQVVLADIEIDKFDHVPDIYAALESTVVKALEESSFETLEALGSHLAMEISAFLSKTDSRGAFPIRISLEKPTAVPFADAPVVEILSTSGGSL